VNIKNIKELGGIQDSKTNLRIGATVTIDELLESADVRKSFPSLTAAARGVASPQIRNMGTVGGDLCQRPRCWYYRGGHGLLGKSKDGASLIPNGENKFHAILGNSGPAYFVSASSLGPALIARRGRWSRQRKREVAAEALRHSADDAAARSPCTPTSCSPNNIPHRRQERNLRSPPNRRRLASPLRWLG
jgi:hypothetical protein